MLAKDAILDESIFLIHLDHPNRYSNSTNSVYLVTICQQSAKQKHSRPITVFPTTSIETTNRAPTQTGPADQKSQASRCHDEPQHPIAPQTSSAEGAKSELTSRDPVSAIVAPPLSFLFTVPVPVSVLKPRQRARNKLRSWRRLPLQNDHTPAPAYTSSFNGARPREEPMRLLQRLVTANVYGILYGIYSACCFFGRAQQGMLAPSRARLPYPTTALRDAYPLSADGQAGVSKSERYKNYHCVLLCTVYMPGQARYHAIVPICFLDVDHVEFY